MPDGCEIKTNQGRRIRVDAHGAHPGLHLGVTWKFQEGEVVINGVWVAYVRIADHRESGRNVKVESTPKSHFVENINFFIINFSTPDHWVSIWNYKNTGP